jgi:hypothetical protein
MEKLQLEFFELIFHKGKTVVTDNSNQGLNALFIS